MAAKQADALRNKVLTAFQKHYPSRYEYMTKALKAKVDSSFKETHRMGRHLQFELNLKFENITNEEVCDASEEGYRNFPEMAGEIIYVYLSQSNFNSPKVTYLSTTKDVSKYIVDVQL